jgi:hypothetical protein
MAQEQTSNGTILCRLASVWLKRVPSRCRHVAGFQWAFWVTGLTGLAAVPVTLLLIRRTELARAVAASLQREPSVAAAD